MSTRASIVITDEIGGKLYFYRHCDGYPDGAMPTLKRFINAVKAGKIRKNVGQACGWLILMGADEDFYKAENLGLDSLSRDIGEKLEKYKNLISTDPKYNWKCGAIEPTYGRKMPAVSQFSFQTPEDLDNPQSGLNYRVGEVAA